MRLIHAGLVAAVLGAAAVLPAAAQETPPATPHPPAASGQAGSSATQAVAQQPAQDARDREIAELKRLVGELRTRLEASEGLKQVIEQLMKRIEALEQSRPAPPAATAPESPQRASATLIPNISVIGNIQFRAGDKSAIPNRGRFNFDELEVAIQDAVSPSLRYDLFLAAAKEEGWSVGMEEGYVSASRLGPGLTGRAGRIRTPFGKFNPLHPHQRLFVSQPSAVSAYLGPEGLISDGAVLEYLLPLKGIFARAEMGRWETTSEAEDGFGFGGGENGAWSGRLWLAKEVGRDRELELGFSRYMGRGDVDGFGRHKKAVNGADLTFRSYPGNYRRWWLSAEALAHETRGIGGQTKTRLGGFLYAAHRWNRFWEAGLRGDYAEHAFPLDGREYGASAFLTKYITEQTSLRLEYRYLNSTDFGSANGIFLQLLFGSGPHKHRLE